jgi:hypothetical protein
VVLVRPPLHLRLLYLFGVRPSERWLPWMEATIRSPRLLVIVAERWLLLWGAFLLSVVLRGFVGPHPDPGEAAFLIVLVAFMLLVTPLVAAQADTWREREIARIRLVSSPLERTLSTLALALLAWLVLSPWSQPWWLTFIVIGLIAATRRRARLRSAGG